MKGALACYVEAVRAIQDAGLRLRGDVVIAAVVGEIEKAQWGEEFRGSEFRGYAAGSRYLPTHGGIADMCILGEPTEQRVVLGHYGTMWARISTHGPFIHTAFTSGRLRARTRSCGCSACSPTSSPGSPSGSAAPPTAGSTASSTSARCAPASPGGSAAPRTGPTSFSIFASRRRWR